jgi:hypothetical protein
VQWQVHDINLVACALYFAPWLLDLALLDEMHFAVGLKHPEQLFVLRVVDWEDFKRVDVVEGEFSVG